jgi:hypothetical protein
MGFFYPMIDHLASPASRPPGRTRGITYPLVLRAPGGEVHAPARSSQ